MRLQQETYKARGSLRHRNWYFTTFIHYLYSIVSSTLSYICKHYWKVSLMSFGTKQICRLWMWLETVSFQNVQTCLWLLFYPRICILAEIYQHDLHSVTCSQLSLLQITTALQILSVVMIYISIQFIADYSVAEPEIDIKTVIAMVIRGLMQ